MGGEKKEETRSPWAFQVARVAGIPVRIHFTFLLFLAWIALIGRRQGDPMWPMLVLAVFGCVLLHEFGHALTARKFGVPTRDITLYPIGGVAMLRRRPTPRQELWITLAGPAVNAAIALVAGVVLLAQGHGLPPITMGMNRGSFLPDLFVANVVLAVFNMIPAFPMDGGRVLRSILALNMDEARATQIAGTVGQGLAVLLGFVGLFQGSILLMIVAFFVFLGAGQEVAVTHTRALLTGQKVADAMQVRFRVIDHGATFQQAADMLLAGSQHDFPVRAGEELVGVITRRAIIEGLAANGADGYIAPAVVRDPQTAVPHLPLERAADFFQGDEPAPVLVMDEDRLVGMLTRENLNEFLMLQDARERARHYGYTA